MTTDESRKTGDQDATGPMTSLKWAESIGEDEAARLKDLATGVRDQDDLERDIGRQADQLLNEQADEHDQKRLEKAQSDKESLDRQVRKLEQRLKRPTAHATARVYRAEKLHLEQSIKSLNTDIEQIQTRIKQRHADGEQDGENLEQESGNRRMPGESQRDFLIRTGKITPFSRVPGRRLSRSDSTLQEILLDAELEESEAEPNFEGSPDKELLSHRNLVQPGFQDDNDSDASFGASKEAKRPQKRRRIQVKRALAEKNETLAQDATSKGGKAYSDVSSKEEDAYVPDGDHEATKSDDTEIQSSEDGEDLDFANTSPAPRRAKKRKGRESTIDSQREDLTGLDDGNEKLYQARLNRWIKRRSAARRKIQKKESSSVQAADDLSDDLSKDHPDLPWAAQSQTDSDNDSEDEGEIIHRKEWNLPHPVVSDTSFESGFRIPGDIYPSLFAYQKTGVRWLWELWSQKVGGIVGDEMGLGKTIQVISFLAGLHYSGKLTRPVIIVAPATVMKQWVNEFHKWWPPLRVSILHTSGSGMIDLGRECRNEDELISAPPTSDRETPLTGAHRSARHIVDRVVQEGHILVTTYSGLQTYANLLIPVIWEYAVLDEGHKIRNPNAAITIYCKELRTPNRIILSGTPMQNNLVELWSLFDYIFPMRLGTLVNFRQQFEFPIRQGGYANASNLQVQTAMKCAEMLKDTISPYLLQRFKADVAADLPKKSEQVLFCKLTKFQREAYESFLASDELKAIMNGKRQVLYGIDILRKICNHPDLQEHKTLSKKIGYNYGGGAKSGKMQVVKALLELWKEQGHKTLLFAQHRIMLDILEKFIRSFGGFSCRRMDGTTPIHTRQNLVDDFNSSPDAHVFLLTTKVGGLGVNLTGADRVIIYDPDWNPSTDVQARERAWRLGQKREVMIYRLMTAGTIEEKIYHRQLFKQFLINKILRDPKQRQSFQMKDLHDLFTLGGENDSTTETSQLFKGNEVRFDKQDAPMEPVEANSRKTPDISISTTYGEEDVRQLTGVASIERLHGEEAETHKAASADSINSESRVMEGIFARSGVQAALEHDQIINGRKVITADPHIIEQEAKRVAAAAAKELKQAGEAAKNVPMGTPTWTGQFGSAGRPEQQQRGFGRGRGGPASSSILAGLQNRQAANLNGSASRGGVPSSSNTSGPRGVDFMKMIRDFLITHGGQVPSQMLVDHFSRYCTTGAKTAEFKAMLGEIAKLEKAGRGRRGRWILKDEYKARA